MRGAVKKVSVILRRWPGSCLILICSFAVFFLAHRSVFSPSLRHGMVEDGSVSWFAGEFLSDASPAVKYKMLMDSDGRQNGRYRPGYYAFETLPFFLTLVKNGDYQPGMSGSVIQQRINGDLRFHIQYLLGSLAFAAGLMSIYVFWSTGSILYALLLPIAFVTSSSFVRNITYNDTAEPPQILGIAVYLFLLLVGERWLNTRRYRSVFCMLLSLPVLCFAYLAKETSVVLFPAVILFVVFRGIDRKDFFCRRRITYMAAHAVANAVMLLWVLYNVKKVKSAYSAGYQAPETHILVDRFAEYAGIVAKSPWSVYILLPAAGLLVWHAIRMRKAPSFGSVMGTISVAALFSSLACAFLFVNLPWEWVLERYMLPVAFFSVCASMMCLGYLDRLLKIRRMQKVRCVAAAALLLMASPSMHRELIRIPRHYDQEYSAHYIVDDLAVDIARLAGKNGNQRILLDIGQESSWLWMQLARILDREYKLNISLPQNVFSPERLYLRDHAGAPCVMLYPDDGSGLGGAEFDIVYSSLPAESPERQQKASRQDLLKAKYSLAPDFKAQVNRGGHNFEVLRYDMGTTEN